MSTQQYRYALDDLSRCMPSRRHGARRGRRLADAKIAHAPGPAKHYQRHHHARRQYMRVHELLVLLLFLAALEEGWLAQVLIQSRNLGGTFLHHNLFFERIA